MQDKPKPLPATLGAVLRVRQAIRGGPRKRQDIIVKLARRPGSGFGMVVAREGGGTSQRQHYAYGVTSRLRVQAGTLKMLCMRPQQRQII